ncbi:hypothetical protein L2E82_32987 [Cichorium intybus]|uniref:Uncharacterized protein n=1 Tax=Cichorium intybus TaxID=13427 RepID=A0ACB9BHV7_CICIN|nr:hypothetical protein L2E82_32987 [Cichorium intybus]
MGEENEDDTTENYGAGMEGRFGRELLLQVWRDRPRVLLIEGATADIALGCVKSMLVVLFLSCLRKPTYTLSLDVNGQMGQREEDVLGTM